MPHCHGRATWPDRSRRAAGASVAPERGARARSAPLPRSDFEALPDNMTLIPPDTHGAVGPSHLMVSLNSQVRVSNRAGTPLVADRTLNGFWAAVERRRRHLRPARVYDPYAEPLGHGGLRRRAQRELGDAARRLADRRPHRDLDHVPRRRRQRRHAVGRLPERRLQQQVGGGPVQHVHLRHGRLRALGDLRLRPRGALRRLGAVHGDHGPERLHPGARAHLRHGAERPVPGRGMERRRGRAAAQQAHRAPSAARCSRRSASRSAAPWQCTPLRSTITRRRAARRCSADRDERRAHPEPRLPQREAVGDAHGLLSPPRACRARLGPVVAARRRAAGVLQNGRIDDRVGHATSTRSRASP